MLNYTVFYPENYKEKEEPDDTTLWKVKYSLSSDTIDFPVYIVELCDNVYSERAFPLSYLQTNLEEIGLTLKHDYPFAKEYIYEDKYNVLFTATLIALDIGCYNNLIKMPSKFSKKILEDMNLPETGKYHPEKFHKKLVELLDLSEKKYQLDTEDYINKLIDLENLALRCLEFETMIEWNNIIEVKK